MGNNTKNSKRKQISTKSTPETKPANTLKKIDCTQNEEKDKKKSGPHSHITVRR